MTPVTPIIVDVETDILPLVPSFLENRKKNLTEIQTMLAEKDYVGIAGIAHKIKGSSGVYGFGDLSDMGRDMEVAAKADDGVKVSESLASMRDYFDRIKIREKV